MKIILLRNGFYKKCFKIWIWRQHRTNKLIVIVNLFGAGLFMEV